MKSRFACPHCGSGLPAADVMKHGKFRCRSDLAFWSLAICLYVLASLAACAMAVRIIRVDRLEDSGH